jgi:hypothetical protein
LFSRKAREKNINPVTKTKKSKKKKKKKKKKNKDIMSFAGKWMELENIILGKFTQTQKDMHGMYSLIRGY